MVPRLSTRRRSIVTGARIERVSQATKVTQAIATREVHEPALTNAHCRQQRCHLACADSAEGP
jgi:hypothetical protein